MLKAILKFYELGNISLGEGVDLEKIINLPIRVDIARAKYIDEKKLELFDELFKKIENGFKEIMNLKEEVK
jgi:V/A-type H+-transporting ATPase subunit A